MKECFTVEVTPKQSESLQLFAFKHGITWASKSTVLEYVHYKYLQFNYKGSKALTASMFGPANCNIIEFITILYNNSPNKIARTYEQK